MMSNGNEPSVATKKCGEGVGAWRAAVVCVDVDPDSTSTRIQRTPRLGPDSMFRSSQARPERDDQTPCSAPPPPSTTPISLAPCSTTGRR